MGRGNRWWHWGSVLSAEGQAGGEAPKEAAWQHGRGRDRGRIGQRGMQARRAGGAREGQKQRGGGGCGQARGVRGRGKGNWRGMGNRRDCEGGARYPEGARCRGAGRGKMRGGYSGEAEAGRARRGVGRGFWARWSARRPAPSPLPLPVTPAPLAPLPSPVALPPCPLPSPSFPAAFPLHLTSPIHRPAFPSPCSPPQCGLVGTSRRVGLSSRHYRRTVGDNKRAGRDDKRRLR
jgi:hypothetical protein